MESVGTSVNGVKALPPVHAFNSALSSACALEHYCVGLACMGVIEQSFATISAIIGNAVVKNGWIRAESLVHYQLHAKIDQRHAEDFYSIIKKPRVDQGSSPRYAGDRGGAGAGDIARFVYI